MDLNNMKTYKVGFMARFTAGFSFMALPWLMLMAVMLVIPLSASAQGVPPQPTADPDEEPYVYDLQTAQQMVYWSGVAESLAEKFAANLTDSHELSDADKVWEFVDEYNLNSPPNALTLSEKKILCLYMDSEADAPPDGLFTSFPAWPNCGGILQTIFGEDFIGGINSAGNDEELQELLRKHQYVLGNIGIRARDIQETIQMQGASGTEYTEEDGSAGMNCKKPSDNINPYVIGGCGVFCTVTKVIMGLLHTASEAMMTAITDNAKFQAAVMAALVLYTVIYGAMVILGFVQIALGDALLRVVKLAVVAMLLTSETVMLFFHMARCFFIEGTTYLIQQVLAIGVGAVESLGASGYGHVEMGALDFSGDGDSICSASFNPDTMGPGPLSALEALLTQIFSGHMFLTLITLMVTNVPFGLIMFFFLLAGLAMLVLAMIKAVVIYLTALIAQYLLLSLLPIFIAFLLFDRTKYLFEGWVNQLVSYSLTPIFLFAYLSLFILVMEASLAQILDSQICWEKLLTIAWVFDFSYWQFWHWDRVKGPLGIAPFGFFEVLIFILLAYLMKEFFNSIEDLARDIGNSYVYVSKAATQLQQWFKGQKGQIKAKAADQRSRFVRGGINKASGAIRGSGTESASGQRGVRGAGGASRGGSVPRSGPK